MGAGGSTYFWLGASADAETGSHPTDGAAVRLRAPRVDPERMIELSSGWICWSDDARRAISSGKARLILSGQFSRWATVMFQ